MAEDLVDVLVGVEVAPGCIRGETPLDWFCHSVVSVKPNESAQRFEQLQGERLERAWRADLPGSTDPHVVVALPSYSLDRSVYEHYGARIGPLENRFLYVILRSQLPGVRTIYLSSLPTPAEVVDGYLALAPPQARTTIEGNSALVSVGDAAPRPLAEKLLDSPHTLTELRRLIGDEIALIEAWNVGEAERDLALALQVPVNGTDPSLRGLATKSAGRRLFRNLGIPTPDGVEGVASAEQVVAAVTTLRKRDPALAGVVVKLDDSVAGDGNVVLRFAELPAAEAALSDAIRRALPAWYLTVLAGGGVVEALITGADFCSPSGQGAIRPDGHIEVLSTHDQRLGGPDGQIYEGCSFPARESYAAEIGRHVAAVGAALAAEGALGRFAVDFAAIRTGGGWALFALEINLRKGGTTHPFGVTRVLTGGSYDPESSSFALTDGTTRYYGATDNLVDEGWLGRSPQVVRQRLATAGVAFDRRSRVGVIPHLLDCLAIDGRMGYTAIAESREQVADLEATVKSALAS